MMSPVIVTSGIVAGKLMRCLMNGHPRLREREIRIKVVDGRGEASILASNILSKWHAPVIVVADADSLAPDMIEEQRGWVEYLLGTSGPLSDWRVLLIAPEVATLLFRDEQLLRSVLPVSPSFEQLIRGRYEPNRVLAELFAQAGEQPFPEVLLERLDKLDGSSLWSAPELRPLEEFLLEKSAAQQPDTAP